MKENQLVEWKESWRDEYLKWVCGFANAEGGTLVIGRNDKGVAVGVKDAVKLLEDIPNKVRDVLGIIVDVNLLEEAGAELLEIRVEPYPSPVSYKGEYHYRSGSTKQELKGAALSRFLMRKQGLHWDGAPLPGLALNDCQPSALQWFRDKAARSGRVDEAVLADGDAALLASLQLEDGAFLKRATSLLFGKQPERFVPGAWIKIGFFATDDDLRYQDEIHRRPVCAGGKNAGPAAYQVPEGLYQLRKHTAPGNLPVSPPGLARGAAQCGDPQGLQQRHPDSDQRL